VVGRDARREAQLRALAATFFQAHLDAAAMRCEEQEIVLRQIFRLTDRRVRPQVGWRGAQHRRQRRQVDIVLTGHLAHAQRQVHALVHEVDVVVVDRHEPQPRQIKSEAFRRKRQRQLKRFDK